MLPLEYRWGTACYRWRTVGVPLAYRWDTDDIPLGYRWGTAGVPLVYRISRKKAGIPPVFLQLIGQYLALRSIDLGRFGLHVPLLFNACLVVGHILISLQCILPRYLGLGKRFPNMYQAKMRKGSFSCMIRLADQSRRSFPWRVYRELLKQCKQC